MKKIYSLFLVPISLFSFSHFSLSSEELKLKKDLISLNNSNLKNNLILSTDSSDEKNVDIFLTGIGNNPQINKKILSDLISIKIKSDYLEEYNDFQSLSLPSVGIKTLTLSGQEDTVNLVITPFEEVLLTEPNIIVKNNTLKLTFPKQDIQINNLSKENIFAIKPIKQAKKSWECCSSSFRRYVCWYNLHT